MPPKVDSRLPNVAHMAEKIAGYDPGSRDAMLDLYGKLHTMRTDTTSATKARDKANSLSVEVFTSWIQLRSILTEYEHLILARWMNKTASKRRAMLLTAWPQMAELHRPDWVALRKESQQQRERGTNYRDWYLWPCINLEDLTKAAILPLFLQSRAQNHPKAFVHMDFWAAHLSLSGKAIRLDHLKLHVMRFDEHDSPDTYGELIRCDDARQTVERSNVHCDLDVGEGLLVLEIQQRMLAFLVSCCEHLLRDHSLNNLPHRQPGTKSAILPSTQPLNGVISLAQIAVERLYRPPQQLDLLRLESLFAGKVSSIEDHIWALREDPGYFVHVLRERREHQPEMLMDAARRPFPMPVEGKGLEAFWLRLVHYTVDDAHLQLEYWTLLHQQVVELRVLQAAEVSSLSTDEILDAKFGHLLHKLQVFLSEMIGINYAILPSLMAASPNLRSYYSRPTDKAAIRGKFWATRRPGTKFTPTQDHLSALVSQLTTPALKLLVTEKVDIIDEIGRLLDTDPSVQSHVSPLVAEFIGDLAIGAEGMRQCVAFQASTQKYNHSTLDEDEHIKAFMSETSRWKKIVTQGKVNLECVAKLVLPGGAIWHYPAGKKYTKDNVDAMRKAEQSLDAVWQAIDEYLQSQASGGFGTSWLAQFLLPQQRLRRTPPFNGSTKYSPKIENQPPAVFAPLQSSTLQNDSTESVTTGYKVSQQAEFATKEKTRGTPSVQHAAEKPSDGTKSCAEAGGSSTQDHIHAVNERSLKVFRTLFYTPSISATSGEVKWVDFQHAMRSMGFLQENLYGSVRRFIPTGQDWGKSIHIHEPHDGKLTYTMARDVGSRLRRYFGWSTSMFVLRERDMAKR